MSSLKQILRHAFECRFFIWEFVSGSTREAGSGEGDEALECACGGYLYGHQGLSPMQTLWSTSEGSYQQRAGRLRHLSSDSVSMWLRVAQGGGGAVKSVALLGMERAPVGWITRGARGGECPMPETVSCTCRRAQMGLWTGASLCSAALG